MNIAQFADYVNQHKITLSGGHSVSMGSGGLGAFSPEIALLRSEWLAVKAGIAPHFYGLMPSAVNEAFPNEDAAQLAYRRRIHTSPTKDKLWKAITDVNRIIMSVNFVTNYGDNLAKWLAQNKAPFNGFNLLEYIGNALYPQRVLDPNGWYAVLPEGLADMAENEQGELVSIQPQSRKDLGVKVMYYPSENLIYKSAEVMIFAEYKINDALVGMVGSGAYIASQLCYRILTKESSFLYNPNGKTPAEMYQEYFQADGREEIPAGLLGGRWIPRVSTNTGLNLSYFESDFSFAVPVMNDLSVVKNQHKAITCTSVFPTTVIREIPCKAEGCNHGKVYEKPIDGSYQVDEHGQAVMHDCKTCNGRGTIDLSALNGISVPKGGLAADDKPISLSDYIYHDSPDVSAVQELGAQVQTANDEVSQALTILQQKVVGQSAESKDADMQDKQTFLSNIAIALARIAENILRWSAYIVLDSPTPAELAQISVAAPKTFNIMTVEALRQLRDQNRASKSLETRASETLKLVEKESNNPLQIRLFELLHEYTQNRSEALPDELNSWLDFGIITKQQYHEALFAGAEIKAELIKNSEISKESLFATLSKRFADLTKKAEIATVFNNRTTPPNAG